MHLLLSALKVCEYCLGVFSVRVCLYGSRDRAAAAAPHLITLDVFTEITTQFEHLLFIQFTNKNAPPIFNKYRI